MAANTSKNSTEFVRTSFGALTQRQNEFWHAVNAFRQHWGEAVQSQLDASAKLMTELASASALPNIVKAYNSFAKQRAELIAEDGKILLDDYQRCAGAAAKCVGFPLAVRDA
jgi:hypothetical protein